MTGPHTKDQVLLILKLSPGKTSVKGMVQSKMFLITNESLKEPLLLEPLASISHINMTGQCSPSSGKPGHSLKGPGVGM